MYARRHLLLSTILLAATVSQSTLSAQQGTARDPLSQSYDKVLSILEPQLVAVARAMPSEKYDFTPATFSVSQADFKGVRTFAAEVKHVAETNYAMYGVMSGLKPDMDVSSIRDLKSKDEIVAALVRSFGYAHRALGSLTLANAAELPADSTEFTMAAIAAYAMVHDADHYGQLSEYLRMNGIIPPQSRR